MTGDRHPVPSLPGTDGKLMSPLDAVVLWAALALILASAVLVPVLMEVSDLGFLSAVSVMTVPFAALGVYGYVSDRRYILLLLSVFLSAVLYFVDPKACLVASVLLLGSEGVSVFGGVVQRLLFFRLCHRLEFYSTKQKRDLTDRAVGFVFGIPEGYDTRNLVMDPHVLRNRFPLDDTLKVVLAAMLLSTFVWFTVLVSSGYSSYMDNLPAVVTFALYAAVLSLPFFVLGSVNLGLRSGRKVLNVSESMSSGVRRMLVFGLLALLTVAVFSGVDADGLATLGISAAAVFAVTVLSCIMYCLNTEAALVRNIAGMWMSELPLGTMEENDVGRDRGFGIPGTPERDCRSCYRDQRDQ